MEQMLEQSLKREKMSTVFELSKNVLQLKEV